MKLKTLLSLAGITLFFSMNTFAFKLGKPIPVTLASHPAIIKRISLINIELTPTERQQFTTFRTLTPLGPDGLPPAADVGMNNTPVFDQGIFGTCATFANTAALDALLGKGDYVSQLCPLELGTYFDDNDPDYDYYPSGWDGSWGGVVLNQLIEFGIVNTTTQKTKICGGLSDYPVQSSDRGNAMPLHDYHVSSENIKDHVVYRPFMTMQDRLSWGDKIDGNSALILHRVKDALANKPIASDPKSAGRVTFATMIPYEYCNVGACGRYHQPSDTWVLTAAMKKDLKGIALHEMVITAYDDNAIVYDDAGKKHRGLLTLRNSWGDKAGDNGNYYMTYDFFRHLVVEAQEVVWFSGS